MPRIMTREQFNKTMQDYFKIVDNYKLTLKQRRQLKNKLINYTRYISSMKLLNSIEEK